MKLVNSFSFHLLNLISYPPLPLQLHTIYSIQNEILEEFDKTSHVNGNEITTTTTKDVNETSVVVEDKNESPAEVINSNTASLRRRCNGRVTNKQHVEKTKTTNSEDWKSLDQFEKLVKSEMEFLTNHQKSNEPTSINMSTKINHQPILKPEKHVSLMFHLTTILYFYEESLSNFGTHVFMLCVPFHFDLSFIVSMRIT